MAFLIPRNGITSLALLIPANSAASVDGATAASAAGAGAATGAGAAGAFSFAISVKVKRAIRVAPVTSVRCAKPWEILRGMGLNQFWQLRS